ncbi:MAG: hypothetical protein K1X89_29525 [Myxococcaceae bacterium]|nr:hypothetical protein [Myxococcaceae bacterium]
MLGTGAHTDVVRSLNRAEEHAPGLWLLRFASVASTVAEHCGPLVPPLVNASKRGPLVVIALVPPELRMVDPSMAPFWLDVFVNRGVRVDAIGVVTSSLAVKVVVSAFHTMMKLREKPIQAKTFKTEAEAVAWGALLVVPRSAQ